MSELGAALGRAAEIVAAYRKGLEWAPVGSPMSRAEVRGALDRELGEGPVALDVVIDELVAAVEPGLVATAGPRFFGFVVGGSHDAGVVADQLASGWDQNAFNPVLSPAAVAVEDVAGVWLKALLGIPSSASVGFATGGQAANTVGLAAARLHVLREAGWDVGRDGLHGAPRVRILAGGERHATIDRAARLLGLGDRSIVSVPVTPMGAMDVTALPALLEEASAQGPVVVCAQTGNVNTGACDDLSTIARVAQAAGAWVHVDGAFGLWAAASPRTRHLVEGVELADSWGCDGHKWLNVPQDAGYAFCAHPEVHAEALTHTAAYLTGQVVGREYGGSDFVPESSRRARGFATWATLRALGRSGVAALVDRCCGHARRLAANLDGVDGIEIVNDVVLNQVLVRVGDSTLTDRLERAIQEDGTCWLGATTWRGERLLRVSFSNWSTTETDVDLCSDTILRLRRELPAHP